MIQCSKVYVFLAFQKHQNHYNPFSGTTDTNFQILHVHVVSAVLKERALSVSFKIIWNAWSKLLWLEEQLKIA